MRWLSSAAVLIAGGLFVMANAPELTEALSGARRPHSGPVAVGVALSVLGMLNRAGKSRSSHRAVGLDVAGWSMLRPTMIGFAADKIFRFAGLSGVAVMVRHGDRMGYPAGAVLASTVVAKVANLASLGLFLVLAVLSLGLDGALNRWWLAAAIGFVVYLAGGGIGLLAAAKNRERADRWWGWVEHRTPRLSRTLGGAHPVAAIARGMSSARANPTRSLQVAAHAALAKSLGVGLLIAASHAAGAPLSPRTALVIYATVLLASMASIAPGGIGTVEASAVAVIVTAGTELSEAIVVVALFRSFDLWIPLLAGGAAAGVARLRDRPVASAPVDRSSVEEIVPGVRV